MIYLSLIIGFVAGILSGLVGIGGGIVMIPALVMTLSYGQHLAQGTALLAMLPPIGIMAVYEYYKKGEVNIMVGLLLAAGFILGGYLGAKIALHLDEVILKKVFGFTMLFFAVKMIFGK
ncbi:MAG: sulfite exporter TauE/SafE family protein [Spirochaetia bacterium]|jgi:uncharacterized membrane protein YfcA|nr:sulfite exporter TauE/SafE family protein [Spirochaetia bacterium]